jgi:hypothetical protein
MNVAKTVHPPSMRRYFETGVLFPMEKMSSIASNYKDVLKFANAERQDDRKPGQAGTAMPRREGTSNATVHRNMA